MGGGHRHHLYVPGGSAVHALPPECKVAATAAFVLAVVLTPREAFWAFALDATIIATIALVAGVRLRRLARRLVIELPFLAFAVFLPFVGGGERVQVGFLSLSVAGLWGAWNILVKGTLGVAATAVLASTTSVPELLRGLDRLHLPKVMTAIASFMVRYGDVLADDLRRMRIARLSRGDDPRWIWQARAVAATAGALFVRSYERGERVYVAMLSRGYDGSLPTLHTATARARDWSLALVAPAAATAICVAAVLSA